jgi:hypothetical protein
MLNIPLYSQLVTSERFDNTIKQGNKHIDSNTNQLRAWFNIKDNSIKGDPTFVARSFLKQNYTKLNLTETTSDLIEDSSY